MTISSVQSCWITGLCRAELRTESLMQEWHSTAPPLLIRSLVSGVSRGTERLVAANQVPPSQYETMRCPFQIGSFPYPVKYGYACVGRVETGPKQWVGQLVFALHPHQDWFILPADQVIKIPQTVPETRAVLAANMETAINASWDAAPLVGMRIAVIGAGTIGGLIAWLAAQVCGTNVTLIDVNSNQSILAHKLGVAFCTPDQAQAAFSDGLADLVYHASGYEAGLQLGLQLAGREASLVELSWYGDRDVTLSLGEDFHTRCLRLLASQVSTIAPAMRARRNHQQRLALALSLLEDPIFDVFLDPEIPFTALPALLEALATGTAASGFMPVIRYD